MVTFVSIMLSYILSETPIFVQSAYIIYYCGGESFHKVLQYQQHSITLHTTHYTSTSTPQTSPYHLLLAPTLLQPFVCLEQSSSVILWWCKCYAVALSQSFHKKTKQKFSPFPIILAGLHAGEDRGEISILFRQIVGSQASVWPGEEARLGEVWPVRSRVWGVQSLPPISVLSFKFAQFFFFSSREIRCMVQSVMRCYITSRLMISCWRLIK